METASSRVVKPSAVSLQLLAFMNRKLDELMADG
jgi:hypothetical protein